MESYFNSNDVQDLNAEQLSAYKLALSGKSLFIMGAGGTGKSYLIEKIYNKLRKLHGSYKVAKTATTGISAWNINGSTIHSWAGIGLGQEDTKTLLKNMYPTKKELWQRVKTIIIDEVSMLNPDLLDKLYEIGLALNSKPIQYIFVGDPFQLPVVDKENKNDKKYFFESKHWNNIIKNNTVKLYTSIRQTDPVFRNILNKVRIGIHTKKMCDILKSRVGIVLTNDQGIKPTIFYSTKKDKDNVNKTELELLKEQGNASLIFKAKTTVQLFNNKLNKDKLLNDFNENCQVDDVIELAVGAQVLFKKNYADLPIVNGTRGVVVRFEDISGSLLPIVRILDGLEIPVEPQDFKSEREDQFKIVKKQIPLQLAWACTIHSSQGLTLDYAIADIGDTIFDYGQSYVVLSRVKTLQGLSLLNFNENKILVNKKVLRKYYPEILILTEEDTRKNIKICDEIIDRVINYIV